MEARIQLQNTKLSKSGHNKFAGYQYFELGDFIPQVQNIFYELGLCGVISYGEERAILTITDIETDKFIEISSPMSEANLKGCHPVQNLGAVETYVRRYLWVAAMEIVEHDALDATTGSENKGKGVHKPTAQESFVPDDDELVYLISIIDRIKANGDDYESSALFLAAENLDVDEKIFVWGNLDSKSRSGIKRYNAEQKGKENV